MKEKREAGIDVTPKSSTSPNTSPLSSVVTEKPITNVHTYSLDKVGAESRKEHPRK